MILPALGAAAAVGWGLWYLFKEDEKPPVKKGTATASAAAPVTHPVTGVPVGKPVVGLPIVGPKAPTTITPPGKPQPPGLLISPPAMPVEVTTPAVHDTAALLLRLFATRVPNPSQIVPEVKAFQRAYNATKPRTSLAEDGKYGPKTQAALQSVVTPAVAPSPGSLAMGPKHAPVAAPTVAVPPVNPSVVGDIAAAANALAMTFASGAKKGTFTPVSTFQVAWNTHKANKPLIADGIYGPASQAALQSVLNWAGAQAGGPPRAAPKNAYGAVGATPKFIP